MGEPDNRDGATAGNAAAWLTVFVGLAAAVIVAFSMRPPLPVRLGYWRVSILATTWIAATVLAGSAGMGIAKSLLSRRPAWPATRHVLGAAAAWTMIPPLYLAWLHGSAWALGLSAHAAAAIAACAYGMMDAPHSKSLQTWEPAWEPQDPGPHFADLPAPDSGRPQAFAIAVCVEAAAVFLSRHNLFLATVLLAAGSFLLVWKRLASLNAQPRDGVARPAARAAVAAMLAMFILVPLLLARFVQMNGGVETTAQAASTPRADAAKSDPNDAYQGIILFTVQQKEKELLPPPMRRDPLRTGVAKQLIIPFNGAYWYFQAPKRGPGTHAHLAHGDPVAVSIYSNSWIPLAMQAHQTLSQPVELSGRGEMRATIRNGDNRPGRIDMGVLLTDSTLPGKPSIYLGIKPIVSTETDHFSFKASPLDEELQFAIPLHPGIRKFDEITVFFFPAEERSTVGARVGIRQFELTPR